MIQWKKAEIKLQKNGSPGQNEPNKAKLTFFSDKMILISEKQNLRK